MVILATVATVIASQAVISGAFSLSQQGMQLSLLPRLDVRQTSTKEIGQVYVPQINWLLTATVIGLVLSFRSSDALAAAYGIAVSGTMLPQGQGITRLRGRWFDLALPGLDRPVRHCRCSIPLSCCARRSGNAKLGAISSPSVPASTS